jgi:hypothetical protein
MYDTSMVCRFSLRLSLLVLSNSRIARSPRTLGGWYPDSADPDGWSTSKTTEVVSAYAHKKNPNETLSSARMAEDLGGKTGVNEVGIRDDRGSAGLPARHDHAAALESRGFDHHAHAIAQRPHCCLRTAVERNARHPAEFTLYALSIATLNITGTTV